MRHRMRASVTPGGRPAPLGARGASGARDTRRSRVAGAGGGAPGEAAAVVLPGASATALAVALVGALAAFAALAAAMRAGGRLVELDGDVARWAAGSMPAWAEWLARPVTWLGGLVGVAVVVFCVSAWLLHRGERQRATLLVVVTVGIQLLVAMAKQGFARERPAFGSAIDLPSSFSFPSGHAASGIAVFGLLGLLAARVPQARSRAIAITGFVVGALVGASRVVLNVHYVSDVLAGACLGLAWLVACVLATRALSLGRRMRGNGAG